MGKRERKVKDNKEKNKEMKDGGWCTEDIRFDQEGCLYIANKDLARMIQQNLNAWGGRLCMFRDFVDDDGDGKDDGGVITDNKVNMMCPCAPEP